jgi:hypothetical protein
MVNSGYFFHVAGGNPPSGAMPIFQNLPEYNEINN